MSRIISSIILIVGLFAWTAVHPQAQTSSNCALIGTQTGAGTPLVITCPDIPTTFAAMLPHSTSGPQGVACTAPASGVAVYAQDPGTLKCFPIITVPAVGFVADVIPKTNPLFWVGRTWDSTHQFSDFPYNTVQYPPTVDTMTMYNGQ
jgi:hypothetical protein